MPQLLPRISAYPQNKACQHIGHTICVLGEVSSKRVPRLREVQNRRKQNLTYESSHERAHEKAHKSAHKQNTKVNFVWVNPSPSHPRECSQQMFTVLPKMYTKGFGHSSSRWSILTCTVLIERSRDGNFTFPSAPNPCSVRQKQPLGCSYPQNFRRLMCSMARGVPEFWCIDQSCGAKFIAAVRWALSSVACERSRPVPPVGQGAADSRKNSISSFLFGRVSVPKASDLCERSLG